ncbi:HalOD1 output domain-containing protein [Haladaptatus sp. NG-SE-30]
MKCDDVGEDNTEVSRWGEIRIHEVVVEALEDHDGIELDSGEWTLYDCIDPDSLDDLFAHEGTTISSVEFTVKGATVTVWQNGEIHVKVD